MSSDSRQRRQWPAKAALAVGAPLVFFAALELVLAALGVKPAVATRDPFVGFAGTAPLFVPETGSDGGQWLVTSDAKLELFNLQRFPRRKTPGTFRVFCLGGSTTYGRPYKDSTSFAGWMREFLPAVDPSRRWEVVNAGGISYASYRVARLMEELVGYEPDLLVVYTGHNEFLEERTYARMREVPASVRALSGALARTRTWALMGGALRGAGLLRRADEPGERFLMPEAVAARLDRSAGLDLYRRDDTLREQVVRHYRSSLERMVEMARSAGVPLLFVTPASNLRSSSPFKSQHTDGLPRERTALAERLLETSDSRSRAGDWRQALSAADEALAFDSRFADLHYQRGRALFGLGRLDEAKPAYIRARDEDVCPLRALSAIENTLRDAAESTGTGPIDFIGLLEQDLERREGHTILGEEDFLDHVHPTIDGHRRLALALIDEMRRRGLTAAGATTDSRAVAEVTERVLAGVDPIEQAEALASLAWTLDWAGKEEDSRRLALLALESGAETPRVLLIAGKHFALEGDFETAVDLYRRAVRADPLSPTPHYQIGLLAINRGELDAAAAQFFLATVLWPDDVKAHEKLGLVMAERGRYDLALASLEEARRRDPGREGLDALIAKVRRVAGPALGAGATPRLVLERYPSGVVRRAAQARLESGRSVPHGIATEWAEDGSLLGVADWVDGEIRGVERRWTSSSGAPAATPSED